MSITAAQRFRLGVFITIALFAMGFIIIVGIGLQLSEKRVTYYSEFFGESLSGLGKGMEVKFRGIPIGKVTAINYNPSDLARVMVTIEVQANFPMKSDMVVETGMSGITGLKYIEIMGGSNEAELLPAGSILASKPSLMTTITNKAETILEQVELFLNNLNKLMDKDSLQDLYALLENMNHFSLTLNEIATDVAPNLESTVFSLNRTMSNLDTFVADFKENGDVLHIINNIDSTVVAVRELAEGFGLSYVQGREDIGATMLDFRETMENLNDLSAMLLENPSLILRGAPQQKRKIK